MSRFNSSISVLGIAEAKVQQAILKLLENSLYQNERIGKTSGNLAEQLRRISQQMSEIGFSNSFTAFGVHLNSRSFSVSDFVHDTSRTYKVQVSFTNNSETTRTCYANGTAVTATQSATTRSPVFTVAGNGSFTVDNYSSDIDAIVHIWR